MRVVSLRPAAARITTHIVRPASHPPSSPSASVLKRGTMLPPRLLRARCPFLIPGIRDRPPTRTTCPLDICVCCSASGNPTCSPAPSATKVDVTVPLTRDTGHPVSPLERGGTNGECGHPARQVIESAKAAIAMHDIVPEVHSYRTA